MPSRRHEFLATAVPGLRKTGDLESERARREARSFIPEARRPSVRVLAFDELDGRTAYELWRLRQQVFVVEQQSPYPDLDGRDLEPTTRHILAEDDSTDGSELVGCLRVLDDETHARIGRVVVAEAARGRGLARDLMSSAMAEIGNREIRLDAQTGLAEWYAGYGFEVSGPEFVEDGVAHLPMRRAQTE